jgi:hypothetical protein
MQNDPLRRPGAANLGAAGLSRNTPTGDARWELGVVLAYNSATHTTLVKTHSGRPLQDVPQMKSTANGFDHLETGTSVVISWDLGFPVIVGVIDFVGPQQSTIVPPSLTGVQGYGDDDPTQPTQGFTSYKPPTAPTDMQQGDWAQVGTHGNHVAVLAGGVTLVGSPTAQVRSMGASGTLQSVARRVQTVTDWGNWQTLNEQGATSFILRAGSSQSTETGQDEQNWGIRLDLGASGDVLDFSITEPQGQVLFKLHAGSDGRVQLYGEGGVDISSGSAGTAEYSSTVDGARTVTVDSSDELSVGGDSTCKIGGACSQQIGGDSQFIVGGGHVGLVTGDRVESTGGNAVTSVVGDTQLSTNGSYEVSAVDEISIATPDKATLSGSKVVLGTIGLHPVSLFDLFLLDLGIFLSVDLPAVVASVLPDPAMASTLAQALAAIAVFAAKVQSGVPYESMVVFND